MNKYLDTKAILLSITASLVLVMCTFFYNRYFVSDIKSHLIMFKNNAEDINPLDQNEVPAIVKIRIENSSNNILKPAKVTIYGVGNKITIIAKYLDIDTDSVINLDKVKYSYRDSVLEIGSLPPLKKEGYYSFVINGMFQRSVDANIVTRSGITRIPKAQYLVGTELFIANSWHELSLFLMLAFLLVVYNYERKKH
jgi:hypothetical protein